MVVMPSLVFALPLLITISGLGDATNANSLPEHHPVGDLNQKIKSGVAWGKRQAPGKPDYYGFLTDEWKRGRYHPEEDYMGFLVGDKKSVEKKNRDGYWDFLGADEFKRDHLRNKRSVNAKTDERSPGSMMKTRDKRMSHLDGLQSWDDFVLGKRGGQHMNFDDFLIGEKRRPGRDYDYEEFVLGKRPQN